MAFSFPHTLDGPILSLGMYGLANADVSPQPSQSVAGDRTVPAIDDAHRPVSPVCGVGRGAATLPLLQTIERPPDEERSTEAGPRTGQPPAQFSEELSAVLRPRPPDPPKNQERFRVLSQATSNEQAAALMLHGCSSFRPSGGLQASLRPRGRVRRTRFVPTRPREAFRVLRTLHRCAS